MGKFAGKQVGKGFKKIDFYPSDVSASDIPIKCKAKDKIASKLETAF